MLKNKIYNKVTGNLAVSIAAVIIIISSSGGGA